MNIGGLRKQDLVVAEGQAALTLTLTETIRNLQNQLDAVDRALGLCEGSRVQRIVELQAMKEPK